MKFLKDGFSIDEMKVSSLVICLFVITGFGCYAYFKYGDITNNWLTLLETIIMSIAGVNVVGSISSVIRSNRGDISNSPFSPTSGEPIQYDHTQKGGF